MIGEYAFEEWVHELSVARNDLVMWPENVRKLAVAYLALKADRDKNPGVWDGSPEWADNAAVQWHDNKGHAIWREKPYTRTLPKTKARKIAERVGKELAGCMDAYTQESEYFANIIESAINEALGGGK